MKVKPYVRGLRADARQAIKAAVQEQIARHVELMKKLQEKMQQIRSDICDDLAEVVAMHYLFLDSGIKEAVDYAKNTLPLIIDFLQVFAGLCPSVQERVTSRVGVIKARLSEIAESVKAAAAKVTA